MIERFWELAPTTPVMSDPQADQVDPSLEVLVLNLILVPVGISEAFQARLVQIAVPPALVWKPVPESVARLK